MSNLLKEALSSIQGLIVNQNIKLLISKNVLENGFVSADVKTLKTFAHIQALNPSTTNKISDNVLSSQIAYKFYIVGDVAQVLNFLDNTSCVVEWQGKAYSIYQKADYSLNGWVQVVGTLKGDCDV